MNEALRKLQNEVTEKAIKLLDTDELAQRMAENLKEQFEKDFKQVLMNDIDFTSWIEDELCNNNSKSAKIINKAIEKVAKKMADSV